MLDKYQNVGWKKFYLIYGMCDETFSVNCTTEVPEGVDKGWFMFFVTLLNQIYWVGGATAGALLGTMVTRFLPFLIFPEGKEPPEFIQYLGKVLPYAVIGLLVIYCLKDVLAVLCALGVAGRAAFFMLPQCKPVLALTILAGAALGGETGFLVGAATMLVSNILFSQGPWTPWQMLGMGLCGFLAGLVFHRGRAPRNRGTLCVFGVVSAFAVYGILLNAYSALLATGALTWQSLAVYCASGFAMDAVQAISTVIFLWFFTEPMLDKLERVKIKYGFA